MKKTALNLFIGESSITIYFHNPWLTKYQLKQNAKYARYWTPSDQKHYTDFHPIEDELLSNLRLMISPPTSQFKHLLEHFHYWLERVKRSVTDPRKLIFKNYQELFTNIESTLNSDKKNFKHYNEIKTRNDQLHKVWKLQRIAHKISERATLVSTPSNARH